MNTDSFWNPECDVKMLEFEAEGEDEKLFSGMESEWIGIKKKEPWWRKADLNDLVLLKSLEHFDNCDLPLPQTSKTKKWLVGDRGLASLNPEKDKYKNSQLSKAELLEALCRSQRRAREAEKAADEACYEKEHVITLFLKQASQIFAYKQCLYILHLENQLSHLIYTPFPNSTKRQLPNTMNKSVGEFLLGLALVGAGVLLGWTLGWFFHSF